MLLTMTVIWLVMLLYIALRAVYPLPLRLRWKLLVIALSLPGALKAVLLRLFVPGGRYFAPDADPALLLPLTWWNQLLLLLFLLLLVSELLKPIVWASARMYGCSLGLRWRRGLAVFHALLLVAAVVMTTLGMRHALALPQVRELTVELPGMPADAAPVRLALLADLHADTLKRESFFRPLVAEVNALQPDVVAIAGDFVDGAVEQHGASLAPLRELRAPLGVYGVLGNHDYYSGAEEWRSFLQTQGVRILCNEHALLGQSGIVLAGVTDLSAPDSEHPDTEAALQDVPQGSPVVLMAHQPRFARTAAAFGRVHLQLSGHTHGGMMRGFDALLAPFNDGFVSGLYKVGQMKLYVSPGTSLWSGMLLRLGVPSEITLITLKPVAPSAEEQGS